ncbi:MAG: TIGR01244 family sulfur transferase [Thermaurantiacus sp.]
MSGPALRRIDDRVSVAGQLWPGEMAALKAAGFAHVVNNRPDGEAPDQPAGADVAAAAEAAGLGYTAIPVDHTGFSVGQVEAMRTLLDAAGGPVVAFCRSGARSAALWALAEARGGRDLEEILGLAAQAGSDLGGLVPLLRQMRKD